MTSRLTLRSLRWLALPLVLIPLGWLLFTGLGRDPRQIPSPLIGHPLPSFSATTLDGATFSSASLRGKPAVVNVWASWCPPCVDEHPVLLETATQRGANLSIVGILYQDTSDGARGFLARYGEGGWPNLLDNGQIAIDLGVTGPPETFFVDARGIVRAHVIGPLTKAEMQRQLTSLGTAP
jgi:cytochrome c biogenesis protein CcmG, thiol:disulfide interchange protein DsbE